MLIKQFQNKFMSKKVFNEAHVYYAIAVKYSLNVRLILGTMCMILSLNTREKHTNVIQLFSVNSFLRALIQFYLLNE